MSVTCKKCNVVYNNDSLAGQHISSSPMCDCGCCVPQEDVVNHPPHYKAGGLECIDIIEAFKLGYHEGNIIKYILRARAKGKMTQDYKKAQWYLNRLIEKTSE